MKNLLLILALFSTPAHACKILFNLNGEQHLAEVGQGGDTVGEKVWDECHGDGPLPADAPAGAAERFMQEVQRTRIVCDKSSEVENHVRRMAEAPCKTVEEKYTEIVPMLRESQALKRAKEARDAAQAEEASQKEAAAQALKDAKQKLREGKASQEDRDELLKALLERVGE